MTLFVRLRPKKQKYFDKIAHFAREYGDAGSLAARALPSEIIFFAGLIEQQKQIEELKQEIKKLKKNY